MSKALGVFAGLALPFFFVLVVGLIFDKKTGGDPFYATGFYLFFLSPLWLAIGIVLAVLGWKREKVRRRVFVAYGMLFALVIVLGIIGAVIRAIVGSRS